MKAKLWYYMQLTESVIIHLEKDFDGCLLVNSSPCFSFFLCFLTVRSAGLQFLLLLHIIHLSCI